MSSNLNNSSTDKSTSSVGTAYSLHVPPSSEEKGISRKVVDLIKYLSTNVESNLSVTELDINPESSPQLENITMETNQIPEDTFKALIDLLHLAEFHHSRLAGFRSRFLNNELIPTGVIEKQEASLRMGGTTTIDELDKVVNQHVHFVEKSRDGFNLRIREVRDQLEHIQSQKGRPNAVKDNIIPQFSASNRAPAPVENVEKVAIGLMAHDRISEKALQEDNQVVIETKSRLEEYLRADDFANEQWGNAFQTICSIKAFREPSIAEVVIMLQWINFVDANLLELIRPLKQFLVPYYGQEIQEVDSFCNVVPKIIRDLELIFSAKEIIQSSHKAVFGNTDPIDPGKLAQVLESQTHKFSYNTGILIHTLREILNNRISSSKSKRAEEKRIASDICHKSLNWRGRPLVKSNEVRTMLKSVENAVVAIHNVSIVADTGKMIMMKLIGGNKNEVERAHVEFDASNDSLWRLRLVLAEDVEASSKRLEELPIEDEPKSHMSQVWERLRFHGQTR